MTRGARGSRGHLTAGDRHLLKALPQPVLQRVEADEPRVGAQQEVLMAAVLGSLPGELECIDEHETCWYAGFERVMCDGIRREPDDIRERAGVKRHCRRRVECRRCGGDEGEVLAGVAA